MANAGNIGMVRDVDFFLTDNIGTSGADGIKWVNSSDGGDTAFARAAAAGRGVHVAGATAATDNNMLEICGDLLDTYGQNGYHSLEVLFQLDVITNIAFNIGFNDDSLDASNTLPIELSTVTFTANAAEFVGLVFDTAATNDDAHCCWVDDTSLTGEAIADLRMAGCSLEAAKWIMARVALQDRGSGKGLRATFTVAYDGKTFEKEFNTTIDRDAALVPYIGFENRTASAHNVYIKYIAREQAIAD